MLNALPCLQLGDKTVWLLGTAHISTESIQQVNDALTDVSPDCVCVELDQMRWQTLQQGQDWENLNLLQILKKKQTGLLLSNLVLSAYQRRLGEQTGVQPGAELKAAMEGAREAGLLTALIDRPVRTTLLRLWRRTPWWRKLSLMAQLLGSMLIPQKIDEQELKRLKEQDTLNALLEEMQDILPHAKQVLVDERDQYMAQKIRLASGTRILAVVGAAHVPGIKQQLQNTAPPTTEALEEIPAKPIISRILPWLVPVIILGIFVYGGFTAETSQLKQALWAWVIANGALSALGATLALAHPLTILAAFAAAPLTSLNPTIGAGMVTGLVQAFVAPPRVMDLQEVTEKASHWRNWWRNRLLRVLTVFVLSSAGSAVGTFVTLPWLKELF